MANVHHQNDAYVLRRIVPGGVLVSSHHPKVGAVFWDFIRDADRNGHDLFGLTTNIHAAHRFWRGRVQFHDVMDRIWASNEAEGKMTMGEPGDENCFVFSPVVPAGDFEVIARIAGVAVWEIAKWFRDASWIEIPAPPTAFFFRRYDGSVGHRDEWTEHLAEAHRFPASQVLQNEEFDEVRWHGRLVAAAFAEKLPQSQSVTRDDINHALEADVAWTLHRCGVGTPGMARKALQHAGTAGWIFAGAGGDRVSGHISEFPQLFDAFETGRALHESLHSTTPNEET